MKIANIRARMGINSRLKIPILARILATYELERRKSMTLGHPLRASFAYKPAQMGFCAVDEILVSIPNSEKCSQRLQRTNSQIYYWYRYQFRIINSSQAKRGSLRASFGYKPAQMGSAQLESTPYGGQLGPALTETFGKAAFSSCQLWRMRGSRLMRPQPFLHPASVDWG